MMIDNENFLALSKSTAPKFIIIVIIIIVIFLFIIRECGKNYYCRY